DESIGCFRQAIKLDPRVGNAYYCLAVGLAIRGDLNESVEAYRQTIEYEPDFEPAHVNLLYHLHRLGRYAEVIQDLEKWVGVHPGKENRCALAGLSAMLVNCRDENLRDPKRALKLARQSEYPSLIGAAHYRLGQWHEALVTLQRAGQASPDNCFFLAMSHWQL